MKRVHDFMEERIEAKLHKDAMRARAGNLPFTKAVLTGDSEFSTKIEKWSREELVTNKGELSTELNGLKIRLSESIPYLEFKELDRRRLYATREIVLIDRELGKRRARHMDEREQKQKADVGVHQAAKKEIDWTSHFVRMAKRILSEDSFRRIEEATEEHVADIISGRAKDNVDE